ncbi:MAG: ABC transporter substrate-binding protein [Gemmatimonadaceae bacterium]
MTIRTSLLAGFLAVASACSQHAADRILLGAAGPWQENFGAMNRRGIELAVDQINGAPDRQGPQVEIVFRDDEGSGTKAAAIAEEFVRNPAMTAVIGHVNSGAMVAAAKVYDGRMPAVATTASSPDLSGISSWTFRVISSDSANGIELARFAARRGAKRVGILYENNSYGRGLVEAFRRAYDGQVVNFDPIAEGASNFEPMVSFYKLARPDLVVVAGTDASGFAFLREVRKQGLRTELVGGDGWTGLVTDTAASEGVWVGAPFTAEDPRPEAQAFVKAFRQKYGVTPDGNAALAYDATRLMVEAVRRAGTDRDKVRDFLASLRDGDGFPGATGILKFDTSGDPLGKSVVMTRIHNGALLVEEATR